MKHPYFVSLLVFLATAVATVAGTVVLWAPGASDKVATGVQTGGGIGAIALALIAVWLGSRRSRSGEERPHVRADHTSSPIGGDATGSTIVTGSEVTIVQSGATVLQGAVEGVSTGTAPTSDARHQLPPPPGDFTGRAAELDELMAKLGGGGATISGISGIQGMGGVGKTALALKLGEQLSGRYPDAQIYLDLKGASQQKALSTADAMAHVIRSFDRQAQIPEGEAELRGLYQSVLYEKRAILLMDNAADREQVEPLIPRSSCGSWSPPGSDSLCPV